MRVLEEQSFPDRKKELRSAVHVQRRDYLRYLDGFPQFPIDMISSPMDDPG